MKAPLIEDPQELFLLGQWVRGKLPYCDKQVAHIMSTLPGDTMMLIMDMRDFAEHAFACVLDERFEIESTVDQG